MKFRQILTLYFFTSLADYYSVIAQVYFCWPKDFAPQCPCLRARSKAQVKKVNKQAYDKQILCTQLHRKQLQITTKIF